MNEPESNETNPHPPRGIRSFVLRQGRMSPAQTRAYETLGAQYMIPFAERTPIDYRATFAREAPVVLEIGFGMGETSAKISEARPDTDFIGIEVHTPGVGSLLKRVAAQSLANQRIVQHDAVEVLEHMIAADSLAGIHIYFPDPWPKKRHHKRRLIQPAFVSELAKRLKPGGYLHLATDWQNYAEHMLEVLRGEALLVNTANDYAPRPDWRPLTNFEQKGLAKGHAVWDLMFHRR